MKHLTFNLSEAEANIMLNALAQMPFVQVHALIAKLQQQASEQTKQD